MSVSSRSFLALALAGGVSSVGCGAASTVSAPRVPVPVLLGPVDRVGGHRAAPLADEGDDPSVTDFSVEVEDFVSSSRDTKQVGNLLVTRTTVATLHDGEAKVSASVLHATNAQHDRDVRVRRLHAGAWVWITPDCASMMRSAWIDVDASATATATTKAAAR